MNTTSWAEHELLHAGLPDKRLRQRLVPLARDLAANPNASLPEATGAWAPAKAAYRFFSNQRVADDAIRDAHVQRSVERLPHGGFFPALQDTTDFDFTSHPATKELGYLGHPKPFGLLVPSALAAPPRGRPVGVASPEGLDARRPTARPAPEPPTEGDEGQGEPTLD